MRRCPKDFGAAKDCAGLIENVMEVLGSYVVADANAFD